VRIILAATAVSLLATPAMAETFNTTSVDIVHAAANLVVIPEDRTNIDVAISAGGGRVAAPQARMTAEGLVIDGGLRNRFRGCTNTLTGQTVARIRGIGNVQRQDLPQITLRVPRTLDLSAAGAVYSEIGASAGGDVVVSGCGDTELASTSSALRVTLNGSGGVDVDAVGGALTAVVNGSGSVEVERVSGEATLRLNGSGDLEVGNVGGALNAQLAGSGSLRTGNSRAAHLVLNGSGDLTAGAVDGALDANLTGSGSMRVASVEGASADLTLTSSGSLVVNGGRVERLRANSTGSGGVRFNGAASTTTATLTGSGSISIADGGRVEQMRDSGSGSINIGR
jgi:hypothetical protein